MALSNYTELKTSVADWLHMNELNALVPDFIALAESSLNRKLSARVFETETPLTSTNNSRYISLPSDYLEPLALWVTDDQQHRELTYKTPANLPIQPTVSGEPDFWTIDGSNVAFEIPVNGAITFLFRYRQKFALSTALPTNWLLTNHPDVYLFGSLLSAAAYIRDNEQLGIWKQAFDMAFEEVQLQEHKHNQLSTLSFDIRPSRSNIYEG